jgi:hypothetical protein
MYNPIKDIVFYYVEEPVLHTSKLGYLQYVLKSAVKYSTKCTVWLIADNDPNIEGVSYVSRESLKNDLAEEYKANFAYPYVVNPEQYVFEGINRWFYINELVKQKGLTSFANFDTDVMVLTEVSETDQLHPIATHIGYDHFVTDKIRTDFICPHVFFCNDVKILDDYCQYCVYLFKDKTSEYYRLCEEMARHKQPDGITDMATLGLYMTRHRHYFGYGTGIINGSCYDVAIEGSDGLDMDGEFKRFEKVGSDFWGFVNGERNVKINSLHFNGHYKQYIQEFYNKYIA